MIDAGSELLVVDRADTANARATVAMPDLRSFTLVGDELWCVSGGKGAIGLVRVGLDGKTRGSRLALDGGERLIPARDRHAAIWLGKRAQEVRLDGETLVASPLD